MMPGPSGSSACARISQRLSALTRPQLGFEIQLEQQPFARYESALWQRLMQKQAPDLFSSQRPRPWQPMCTTSLMVAWYRE